MLKDEKIKENIENEAIRSYLSKCKTKIQTFNKVNLVETYSDLLKDLMKFSRQVCALAIQLGFERKNKFYYKKLLFGISEVIDDYIRLLQQLYEILILSDLNSEYYYKKFNDIQNIFNEFNEKINHIKL